MPRGKNRKFSRDFDLTVRKTVKCASPIWVAKRVGMSMASTGVVDGDDNFKSLLNAFPWVDP
ncbi:MAG: hypothetical protein BGP09_02015 [Rhizobium sp. 60-20]|nr:MAG: hypothetical protein BGP09_02015 [Rhizobium sp. 60-20]